ncbi:hypothetical protein R3W88_007978 [Solanum pinnatisectum]|uniref:Craniofacial development protein 2-like n=1 Tax=Solanum pinnatisectum TaxID=50273 RepID=A0AAV9M776_9SOLN|nr:hypothetical protein R3W88_007978 [Solanum pinnatisectum]
MGKSIEFVKILKKRTIIITCVQDTRWDVSRYRNRVGILFDGDLQEQVVEARRINEKMMMIKLVVDLDVVVRGIPNMEKTFIGGDINGKIREASSDFDDVHEGYCFAERNGGGGFLLDFAKHFYLVIANSYFLILQNNLETFRSTIAMT